MRVSNKVALLIVLCSSFLLRAGCAQNSCFNASQWCDPWWDGKATINNPDCLYYPGSSFLLSTTPSSGPSEGYRNTGIGKPCGVTTGIPQPCGVQTTTDTCAESTPAVCTPPLSSDCCTTTDPTCCDPFTDPECGGGLAPGDPCGDDGDGCADGANPGLAATLRKAVLVSPLPKSVSTLLQQLAPARAIYLKAQVTITNPADGTKQTGSYEYWERDGHYRLRLGSGLNYPMEDIAFDGTFLQGRTNQIGAQISRGDNRFTPFPDGPLALALAQLRVADPAACPSCQLRLADLAKAVQWRREASAKLVSAERQIGTGSFDAGAQRTGESDAAGRLVRLVWPADKASGQHLQITLSNYQPIGGTSAVFPMNLTESIEPNSTTVQYTVEKIDLSSSFQDDVFDVYSTAPKLAFLAVAKDGTLHKRFLRYVPSPGGPSCSAKAPAGGPQQ